MILLVSGATTTLRGLPDDAPVGHLITPAAQNRIDVIAASGRPIAADNGCGPKRDGTPGELDEPALWVMLAAVRAMPWLRLLFAVVPDAVGDAAETLRMWRYYSGAVGAALGAGCRPPLAFVAQDGAEEPGMVPWGKFTTLFVGGSTEWKEGDGARTLIRQALGRGLRVHVGRVNTERRLRLFDDLGRGPDGYPLEVHSCDGTQFSMYPDTYIPRWAERLRPSARQQPRQLAPLPLFDEAA